MGRFAVTKWEISSVGVVAIGSVSVLAGSLCCRINMIRRYLVINVMQFTLGFNRLFGCDDSDLRRITISCDR